MRPPTYSTTEIDLAAFLASRGHHPTVRHDDRLDLGVFEFSNSPDLLSDIAFFTSGCTEKDLLNVRNRLFKQIRNLRRWS